MSRTGQRGNLSVYYPRHSHAEEATACFRCGEHVANRARLKNTAYGPRMRLRQKPNRVLLYFFWFVALSPWRNRTGGKTVLSFPCGGHVANRAAGKFISLLPAAQLCGESYSPLFLRRANYKLEVESGSSQPAVNLQ